MGEEGRFFNLRMPVVSRSRLERMADFYRRSLSDMILWLIDEEFRRMGQEMKVSETQDEDAMVGGAPEIEKECE